MQGIALTQNNKFSSCSYSHQAFCYLEFESLALASITHLRMSDHNIADLLALDTGALKSRLSELRRYL
jgi:hypothetical protein